MGRMVMQGERMLSFGTLHSLHGHALPARPAIVLHG